MRNSFLRLKSGPTIHNDAVRAVLGRADKNVSAGRGRGWKLVDFKAQLIETHRKFVKRFRDATLSAR